ncbi:hypothetical protein NUW58_g4653 [Xylaria curta]|uniref:Uncharacterized protein n=1 Tax=Xylaria curta TaxID=42375 RepID=A0ACC1P6Z1_9PEZI|nr:hypothetical protein NUW58_g4653 [Xylaria curta]
MATPLPPQFGCNPPNTQGVQDLDEQGDHGRQSCHQSEQPSQIHPVESDECTTPPTTISESSKSTSILRPQVALQSSLILTATPPCLEVGRIEEKPEAVLMLGDIRYTHQEVRRQLAHPKILPRSQQSQVIKATPPPADDDGLEPFPVYEDPFGVWLILGELGYYRLYRICRPSNRQRKGKQMIFPGDSIFDEFGKIHDARQIQHGVPTLQRLMALNQPKKSLNVDSPSFTPTQLGGKKSAFSTSAVPFTPRGSSTTTSSPALQQDTGTTLFKPAQFTDFSHSNYDINSTDVVNGTSDNSLGFDPFMSSVSQGLQSAQYNPYAEEHNPLTAAGASYYGPQNTYSSPSQPLQYHLYYPLAPIRDSLQPYQRAVFDLFLPESLREGLQKKSEAARQVLASQPGVQSPSLQQYHSLVPLDIKLKNTPGIFGLPTWVWKATSRKNGNVYCFRLTNEDAIKAVNSWKKIIHPNIATTVEAFTTRDFNDSSLIFVHSYHPLSKTLAEHHFPTTANRFGRSAPVQEKVLWSYLVQLSSALKVIHKAKLAARCIDISKVILTDKNRIKLSACSILDVIHFEAHRRIEDLQQEDFFNLGKLIISIGTNTPPRNEQNLRTLLEQLGRSYSDELKERVAWLLSAPQTQYKTAEQLIRDLAIHVDDVFVSSTNAYDEAINHLGRELENGRLVRLLAKLGTINERPEFDGDPNWSETEHRYTLKLFRDYVFHQVDAQGNPALDLGHIISCLNKLDAGTEEKIYLTSRDHQSTFLVTYRELKKQVQSAFGDLQKGNTKQQQQTNRGF